MANHSSLSIIVPALNEEKNLRAAVQNALRIASRHFSEIEVLIFNDGSTDRTGEIADELARELTRDNVVVRAIHHPSPQNLGACYKQGLALAKNEYVIMVPGDNECTEGVVDRVFSVAGSADIIIPYTDNSHTRPLGRQVISTAFVKLLNLLSGCNLRYYNGTVLHRTALVRECHIETDSFGYQAEALVKMLRAGCTYLEVATEIEVRTEGKSKAFSAKNLVQTAQFLFSLARSH